MHTDGVGPEWKINIDYSDEQKNFPLEFQLAFS